MIVEKTIKRYAAYYMGWCQAFGEHEVVDEGEDGVQWIVGDQKMGLILPPAIRKLFIRELVGRKRKDPTIVFSRWSSRIEINESVCPLVQAGHQTGLEHLIELIAGGGEVHMFLTKHFFYPPGTRIVSFSRNRPLNILYKEIDPLKLRIN